MRKGTRGPFGPTAGAGSLALILILALSLTVAIAGAGWRQVEAARERALSANAERAALRTRLPSLEADPLARGNFPPARVIMPDTAARLSEYFDALSYRLGQIRSGEARVPRIYALQLPQDIADIPEIEHKKRIFIRTVLPLILKVNEEVHGARRRIKAMRARLTDGHRLAENEATWLRSTAERYGLGDDFDGGDIEAKALTRLLRRVDEVPASLALAQSIQESGWGRSRFARQGNALFGQRTWNGKNRGMQPKDVDADADFRVRVFVNLASGIRSYVHNLNTHQSYAELRDLRARLRAEGRRPSGYELAGALSSYSTEGIAYVRKLHSLIRSNGLRALDDASLDPHSVARELAFDPRADEIKVTYELGTRN